MTGDDERNTDSPAHIDELGDRTEGAHATSNDGTTTNPSEQPTRRPEPPDLPAYVLDPLHRQSSERLDAIAAYAHQLASWKRGDEATGSDADLGDPATADVADASKAASSDEEGDRIEASSGGDDDRVAARTAFRDTDYSRDPRAYDGVPSDGAYITIKEPKPGYRYFYWQWRDGDTWKNQYIGPVQSSE